MSDPQLTIREAKTAHLDRIESLLEANGLPYQDVRAKPECFVVACVDDETGADGAEVVGTDGAKVVGADGAKVVGADGTKVVGAGGVEVRGSDGLLRSIVVAESSRGQGHGAVLCDSLEGRARESGVETLYLLTTTAAEFFRRRGYEEIPREKASASIRQTSEFTELCPTTATCMMKDIQ